MNRTSTLELIGDLVFRGRVPVAVQGDWLLPASPGVPAVRAQVSPIKTSDVTTTVQLDVEIVPDGQHRLVESFAGVGASFEAAVQDAVAGFRNGALDVLLSVFWQVQDQGRVEVETWSVGGRLYVVTIGQWLIRNYGADVALPEDTLPVLENLFSTMTAQEEFYWVRIFYCNGGDGAVATEVMLNNSRWADGERQIARMDWAQSPSYYSARLFVVLCTNRTTP